jgi:LysR family transcriptional regulator, glycine cleavage system transcriptional activator
MLIYPLHAIEKPDDRTPENALTSSAGAVQPVFPLRKLPPLNALRSFEVAARYASFTKAAQELLVTPAAVGQQVRQLEDIMGVRLFRRENRMLVLTPAGEACLPGVHEGFAHLVAAVSRAKPQAKTRRLTVSVAPSFAAKWLLPRLSDFESRHPEIDVHVDASMRVVDLHDGAADPAIRYGAGHYPGLRVERLLGEEVIPVCSPSLRDGERPLRTPADLAEHTLLHDDSPDNDPSCPTWAMWLRAAGVIRPDASRGPHFSQSSMVLEAAVLGQGVALAKATIAAADLAAGRVVGLFEMSLPLAFSYHLVYPPIAAQSTKAKSFRTWLFEQALRAPGPSEQ